MSDPQSVPDLPASFAELQKFLKKADEFVAVVIPLVTAAQTISDNLRKTQESAPSAVPVSNPVKESEPAVDTDDTPASAAWFGLSWDFWRTVTAAELGIVIATTPYDSFEDTLDAQAREVSDDDSPIIRVRAAAGVRELFDELGSEILTPAAFAIRNAHDELISLRDGETSPRLWANKVPRIGNWRRVSRSASERLSDDWSDSELTDFMSDWTDEFVQEYAR